MDKNGAMLGILEQLQAGFVSGTSEKWRVELEEYPLILKRILADWMAGATKGKRFVRVTGQSGSGKTTQLVPAVEAWYEKMGAKPILVTASKVAEYHPHRKEIVQECGEEGLRQETDGFAAAMMFLVLRALLAEGYDIILDLALVEPKLEQILIGWLKENSYNFWMTMMAVPPKLSQKWLERRSWRHSEVTEERFLAATGGALGLYVEICPEMRMVMWSAWGTEPIYDGNMGEAMEVWREVINGDEALEGPSVEELVRKKIEYFRKKIS